jgi:hypothetical protein
LVFRPEAEAGFELLEARSWYEKQRPGLGCAFADAVEDVLAGISQTPLAYPFVRGETRRALVQRFPMRSTFASSRPKSSSSP